MRRRGRRVPRFGTQLDDPGSSLEEKSMSGSGLVLPIRLPKFLEQFDPAGMQRTSSPPADPKMCLLNGTDRSPALIGILLGVSCPEFHRAGPRGEPAGAAGVVAYCGLRLGSS